MKFDKIIRGLFFLMMIQNVNMLFAQDVNVIEQTINPAGIIDELPMPPPSLEGNVYLLEDWDKGTVDMKNGQSINEGLYVNYDLQNDLLELKFADKVKVCTPMLLKKFTTENKYGNIKYYENISNYDKSKLGILEIVYSKGSSIFAIQPYVFIQKPNYVPTMDVGNKNNKVFRKANYYLIKDGNLIPFKNSKKGIKNLTGSNYSEVEKYIKKLSINLKEEAELSKLMRYYINLL